MNLTLEKVNSLPAPTWRRLGINDTDLEEQIPEISPYHGQANREPLPEGVVSDGPAPELPPMETGMGAEAAAFTEKNHNSGVNLRAQAGKKVSAPVFLRYRVDGTNPAIVDSNTIVAEEGSELTVVMSYSSAAETEGFHGGLTRIHAEKGAVVHLVQVQMLGDRCLHYSDIGALAEEGAKIDLVQAELGGRKALTGFQTLLEGREAFLNIDTIYFGDRKRSIDFNYVAEHTGRKTQTEIHVSGALLDESRKTFRGTIDFKKGASRAVGHESEYNLLFSPKVRNLTAPLILCSEEDVEGQHAASTGKIDESKLFYLMSRGLDELAAKKLVIEAQFRPVTDRIPDPALRDAISEYVKERLGSIESIS